jgi:hypothetical protein
MHLRKVGRDAFLEAFARAKRVSIHQTPIVEEFVSGIAPSILKFDVCSVCELFEDMTRFHRR